MFVASLESLDDGMFRCRPFGIGYWFYFSHAMFEIYFYLVHDLQLPANLCSAAWDVWVMGVRAGPQVATMRRGEIGEDAEDSHVSD